MSFPPFVAPAEDFSHLGGVRAGLDFPASNGPVDQAAFRGLSRGAQAQAQASADGDLGQGTEFAHVPDCFGFWCCLQECDCGCHDPETVFREKPPVLPEGTKLGKGLIPQKMKMSTVSGRETSPSLAVPCPRRGLRVPRTPVTA